MSKWALNNYFDITGTIDGILTTNFIDKSTQKIVDAHNKEVDLLQKEIERLQYVIASAKNYEDEDIMDQDTLVVLAAREINPPIPLKGK